MAIAFMDGKYRLGIRLLVLQSVFHNYLCRQQQGLSTPVYIYANETII